MPYQNLPGIFERRNESGDTLVPASDSPVSLILGTSPQGDTEIVHVVNRVATSAKLFGRSGMLIEGMYEAQMGGASNIRLMRIGAEAASLTGIGKSVGSGLTLTTIAKDASVGADYGIFYEDATGRLQVKRLALDLLVFDNNPASPSARVDLGEVSVSGVAEPGLASDIGSSSAFVAMEDVQPADATYTAGGDGESMSRMETYEALERAYRLLESQKIDIVIPKDVYLDDLNVMDLTPSEIQSLALASLSDYPSRGADNDVLGRMYVEEFEGELASWWFLSSDPTAADQELIFNPSGTITIAADAAPDTQLTTASAHGLLTGESVAISGTTSYNGSHVVTVIDATNFTIPVAFVADEQGSFVGQRGAQIAPSVGQASALTKTDGTALSASDFHEVNFAHQLANFCYQQSSDFVDMTGVVPMKPPKSLSLRDVALWVGKAPEAVENSSGKLVIKNGGNGSGLLGNKIMAGRISASGQLVGHTVGGVDGLLYGGLIATDNGFMDGTQLKDDNDFLIDIGAYISVVPMPLIQSNSARANYLGSASALYAGFYSVLPAASAPSNKVVSNARLGFSVSRAKTDLLAGFRYVMFMLKPQGIVVADAPVAARPDSDFTRLSTARQIKAAIDGIRSVVEPFLGEGMDQALIAAMDTAIEGSLKGNVRRRELSSFSHNLVTTPQSRRLGQALLELKLIPAYEFRQLSIAIALSAV